MLEVKKLSTEGGKRAKKLRIDDCRRVRAGRGVPGFYDKILGIYRNLEKLKSGEELNAKDILLTCSRYHSPVWKTSDVGIQAN